ncbi:MAG: GTPase domain-containing protein, partial [Candidatus Heimdallarchaeota archaeon]|nr:GTPase domain-containing protein [Candidatus Heimdallarchaeota archaeon]
YILVTGLMGSGKSTLINEFIIRFEIEPFTKPPVEAKFRGMDFEFIDSVFALKKNDIQYNFYELDEPTINKWVQFINVADVIILVHNKNPKQFYDNHQRLIDNILKHSSDNTPIIFVINNTDDLDDISEIEKYYSASNIKNREIVKIMIGSQESTFDEKFGYRIKIPDQQLSELYDRAIQLIR